MAMRHSPEDYIWLWSVKGFEGIFSLIEKWLNEGIPPTDRLKLGLIEVRTRLDALIAKLP